MPWVCKLLLVVTLLLLNLQITNSQTLKVQRGAVFKKGTTIRLGNAVVYNKIAKYSTSTDNLGVFTIVAATGDTLLISSPSYIDFEVIVTDFKDLIIYLQQSNVLTEVKITGENLQQRLSDTEDSYRKKGVYFKGRPPLIIFLVHPLTFLRERLGKDGKQARRFHDFAERETDYYKVSVRFNDSVIKRLTLIKDEDLAAFKSAYWPTIGQIKQWTDFELYSYIKESYKQFRKTGRP